MPVCVVRDYREVAVFRGKNSSWQCMGGWGGWGVWGVWDGGDGDGGTGWISLIWELFPVGTQKNHYSLQLPVIMQKLP